MKKSAFTLIELLVVITIIAILAGIALPVYGKVLERSKATTDGNNLKQLGLGIAAYLADNDDQIFSSTAINGNFWPAILQAKYVTNWKTFQSPFDKRPAGAQTDVSTIPVSYGVNVNLLTQATGAGQWDGNWSKLVSASQLIIMAPAMDLTNVSVPTFVGLANQAVSLPVPTVTNQKLGTHSGRAFINALYADTHVATLPYVSTAGTSTNTDAFTNTTGVTGLRRWTPFGQ